MDESDEADDGEEAEEALEALLWLEASERVLAELALEADDLLLESLDSLEELDW